MRIEQQIADEKNRLIKQKQKIADQVKELELELKSIDVEIKAIEAYQAAKGGHKTALRAKRHRTSRRQQIVDIIASNGGIGRAAIITTLGVKGNKSAEQSVSNALSAMKKSGAVKHTNGLYSAA